tara:strand:+ start:288 stop:503 length:216 start_codon:yes stop_codon:yes gene_type:complete
MTYKREKLKQSTQDSSKLVISKTRETLGHFAEYVLGVHYNRTDKHGNQIEASKESFEKRWHKAREILLASK